MQPTPTDPANATERPASDFIRGFRERLAATTPEQIAAENRYAAEERLREKQRIEDARLKAWDAIPMQFRDASFDRFRGATGQQAKVVQVLREYDADALRRGEGIVLYGPVGTGKDFLLTATLRPLFLAGVVREFRRVNAQDLFGTFRDAMDSDKSEASILSPLSRTPLLIISDPVPPKGELSQHQATMLYRVIDDRYEARLPTWVSINATSDDEADAAISEPTWDRLCGGAWKLHCNWPSFRKPVRELH